MKWCGVGTFLINTIHLRKLRLANRVTNILESGLFIVA